MKTAGNRGHMRCRTRRGSPAIGQLTRRQRRSGVPTALPRSERRLDVLEVTQRGPPSRYSSSAYIWPAEGRVSGRTWLTSRAGATVKEPVPVGDHFAGVIESHDDAAGAVALKAPNTIS